MGCERCRELVSARLDGEDGPGGDPDAHLAACAACRTWADRAAAVTRLARTGPAASAPDLSAAVVAAATTLPAVRQRRRAAVTVRSGLALVGIGQLALAVLGVLGVAGLTEAGHPAMHTGETGLAHATHETSAWNLALGIGFLAVAWAGGRLVAGLLPVTGAFVAVLAVLSVMDLATGRVEPERLATHALVVAGFLLLLLHRRVLGDDGGRAARTAGAPSRAVPVDEPLPWPGPAAGPGAVAEARRAA